MVGDLASGVLAGAVWVLLAAQHLQPAAPELAWPLAAVAAAGGELSGAV